MILPLLLGLIDAVRNRVKIIPGHLLSVSNWMISCILPFLFTTLFVILFYVFLIDNHIIKDHQLLKQFNLRMRIYGIVGYLAAIGCFGMYLLMSMVLDQLDKKAEEENRRLATDTLLQDEFSLLKTTFDNSFLITAVVLSVFVLWVGIMFTAVNHTEAMSFYKIYSGKDFLSYDFVFLVGAMHTMILLLFYIPVKLRFNSKQLAVDNKITPGTKGGKLLGNLYNGLVTVLLTASPLLTSLLQKLVSGLID